MQKQYHIAVIGGGASGLLAAIAAKIEGGADCSVVILERNDRIGRKILSTGNGRCNLGNTVIQKENYSGSLLEKAFAIFQQAPKTEDYFRQMGLICREEEHRLYPYCNHASAVLDSLRLQIELYGIAVQCNCQIQKMIPKKHGFLLQSDTESYFAEQVIFACGGYAAPALGTDGSAYAMLKDLKIAVRPCTPALCFLKTKTELVRALKGIRLLASVSLYENGVLKRQERGEVQFTEQALSGICIFNLSAYCDRLSHAGLCVSVGTIRIAWNIANRRIFHRDISKKSWAANLKAIWDFTKRITIDCFLYTKGNRTIGIFFESMEISSHRERGLEERTNFLWRYYIRRSIR